MSITPPQDAKYNVSSVTYNYLNFTLTYPKKIQDFKNFTGT